MALRLLIVDDSDQFLEAARSLLERQGFEVVAVASTATQAVRTARELRPDVTLVDIDLGDENGFDVARELTEAALPDPPRVVLISAYPEADLHDFIAASPAVGFLPKSRLSARALHDVLDQRGPAGADTAQGS
jgi:DNA-binding NarL/FixJ family response regulator